MEKLFAVLRCKNGDFVDRIPVVGSHLPEWINYKGRSYHKFMPSDPDPRLCGYYEESPQLALFAAA